MARNAGIFSTWNLPRVKISFLIFYSFLAMSSQSDDQEIESAARTVTQLFDFINELKLNAAELEGVISPAGRSYFVADEDDAVRGLLISYWQSRNALLELVNSYRKRQSLAAAESAEFLVPYAAALVLVDAARFLRGLADNRPPLRRKLNEPATEFGVPGGTYDQIQKSLVSSQHAWQLLRAKQHFDAGREDFQSYAAEHNLADVFDIVERLRDRVDVSKFQFARAKFATWLDQHARWIGRLMFQQSGYSAQKLAAGMMADVYVKPGHTPSIPTDISQQLADQVLQPGDVILVRKEFAVTNYFLPGHWPHVALVIGGSRILQQMPNLDCDTNSNKNGNDAENQIANAQIDRIDNELANSTSTPATELASEKARRYWAEHLAAGEKTCVLESMKDGVRVRRLASPLASDSFVVIRPQLSDTEKLNAICRVLRHAGKPYDFNFDFSRSDRLVCTEVIYRAYEGIGPIRFPLVKRMGRPTLSGFDLIKLSLGTDLFGLVAAYIPEQSRELIVESDAVSAAVLRCLKM